jgi:competence protein ComEC
VSRLADRPWHVAMGGLAAGLACSAAPRPLALAGLAAACVLGFATRRPALALLAAVLLLAGLAIGQARVASIARPAARLRQGSEIRGEAVALGRPRPGPFGASLELELRDGPAARARLLARVPPWLASSGEVEPGAILRVRGSVAGLRRRGGYPAYLRSRGIASELELDSARLTGARRGGIAGVVDGMRRRAERGVAAGLPRAEADLLRGMVLGQDEAIEKAVRADWRRAGLAHLLTRYAMART